MATDEGDESGQQRSRSTAARQLEVERTSPVPHRVIDRVKSEGYPTQPADSYIRSYSPGVKSLSLSFLNPFFLFLLNHTSLLNLLVF
jgi:hypothetical protein